MLFDLLTSNERILYANISEDQQESSAPSGVFPQFAFMPDDSAIVIWSHGGLWSISVATGVATPIPFEVTATVAFAPTVRASVSAATGTSFVARVAQWPSILPASGYILFTAAGRTYARAPVGESIQVTSRPSGYQGSGLEHAPSAAANGQQVRTLSFPTRRSPVASLMRCTGMGRRGEAHDRQKFAHVVWSDTDMAGIDIVTIDQMGRQVGDAIRVPTPMGRYTVPRFSPDVSGDGDGAMGETDGTLPKSAGRADLPACVWHGNVAVHQGRRLVFVRLGSDALSGPLNGANSGIYVIDLIVGKGARTHAHTRTRAHTKESMHTHGFRLGVPPAPH